MCIRDRLQTDNHASISSLEVFAGQMLFLTPTNSVKALKAIYCECDVEVQVNSER